MKIARTVCCLFLLLVSIMVISQSTTVLAREPLKEGEERLVLETKYPALEVTPGESCNFGAELKYLTYLGQGESRAFDLVTTAPKDWLVAITPPYQEDVRLSSITLVPGGTPVEQLLVVVAPPYWYTPEPGEYTITLEVIGETQTGEELKVSLDLKAELTAVYVLELIPATERYNISATAGKDNTFYVNVWNNGSAAIDGIIFSSDKPKGWDIDFSPEEIPSLDADSFREVVVNIKPPPRTIAGDYVITLSTEGEQTSAGEIYIRVTVETPTIWGWVGVGIILVVLAGIVFVFMRFSRR